MLQARARRDALDAAIDEVAGEAPFAEVVGRLVCLRGDWQCFRPQSLGPFLGLTPSEDSTGERRQLGAITMTGNTHARRLHQRWHALESRGRRRTIVAVAVARELAGHCWALATMK